MNNDTAATAATNDHTATTNNDQPSNNAHPPVCILASTVPQQKMEAILALCEAVRNLSDALVSTSVTVEISHCDISNCDTAISIDNS